MGEGNEEGCWHRGRGVGIRTRERTGRELGDMRDKDDGVEESLGGLVRSDEGGRGAGRKKT